MNLTAEEREVILTWRTLNQGKQQMKISIHEWHQFAWHRDEGTHHIPVLVL
jgi:hypothetical protein